MLLVQQRLLHITDIDIAPFYCIGHYVQQIIIKYCTFISSPITYRNKLSEIMSVISLST